MMEILSRRADSRSSSLLWIFLPSSSLLERARVEHTNRVCGVEAFQLRSPRELLAPHSKPKIRDYQRVFRWADACILSGGTPIYDYDHLSRIIHYSLPRILGKELICFGIGVKQIRSWVGRRSVRSLLKRAAAVSTRDLRSKSKLEAIGVRKEIRVTGDSSLFLTPRAPNVRKLGELGLMQDRPLVAICPRALSPDHRAHYHAPLSIEAISKIRRTLALTADHLSRSGHRVVFIPFHEAPPDDDTDEIAMIRGLMRETSLVFERVIPPETVAGFLGQVQLVVGLRLHSLILAAAMGVPSISLNYDPKIAGFMEYAGMKSYLSEPTEPVKTFIERADEGLKNRTTLKRGLLDSCEVMRWRIREEAKRIAGLL
jgi:polysaccharide pyruvyl transferase WcaK-like protein